MRILVVEDSAHLRRALDTGLRDAGFAVDVSADGQDGLWRAQNANYDLIVLDLMLPKLDGLGVLRALRSGGIRTPVLVLTARTAVHERVAGLDEGADDYLAKPFAFEELLARVRSLYRRSFGIERSELTIGSVHLDLRGRRVEVGGQRLELTRREYMLLEYLALRKGETVTRAEIEEHLYDEQREPMSNVVDAAIARLRRKLEARGVGELIRTQRGLGYVLEESAP